MIIFLGIRNQNWSHYGPTSLGRTIIIFNSLLENFDSKLVALLLIDATLSLSRRAPEHAPIRLKFSEQLNPTKIRILCFYTYFFPSRTVKLLMKV